MGAFASVEGERGRENPGTSFIAVANTGTYEEAERNDSLKMVSLGAKAAKQRASVEWRGKPECILCAVAGY
jgi:hypothetical protein